MAFSLRRLAGALDKLAPWRWRATVVHALALVALLGWTALECFGPLPSTAVAASSYDQMQRHRLWASPPDPRILIVDIDERSLADLAPEFGRWPWPRDTLAAVLEHAASAKASAVVFDILISDPDRLHPGGDRALDAAVRSNPIGIFPVVRLPPAIDPQSDLRVDSVPGLLAMPAAPSSPPRVALILPFMESMLASGRLGTHTAQLDGDGKLRRFAAAQSLPGGWSLRSIPLAVAQLLGVDADRSEAERLIVWRRSVDAYPRVPFSVMLRCAEGRAASGCPELAGRILIVGATASSLHDIKTTPLGAQHAGVDILATLIDNALHRRSFDELTPTARWLLSALALLVSWWVVRRGGAGATRRVLWGLPTALLVLSFLSLHTESFFLDLTMPAAAVLAFLSAVKMHDALRLKLCAWRDGTVHGHLALVCGGPPADAERIERVVYDRATVARLCVTGGSQQCGTDPLGQAWWVLWNLPDQTTADGLSRSLANTASGVWCRVVELGPNPQRSLFQALADTSPAPSTLEHSHATA